LASEGLHTLLDIDLAFPGPAGELLKLGFNVSERTVSRYLPRIRPGRGDSPEAPARSSLRSTPGGLAAAGSAGRPGGRISSLLSQRSMPMVGRKQPKKIASALTPGDAR
jgi:hypothetical protein